MENKFCIIGEPRHIKAFWEDLIEQGYKKPASDKLNALHRSAPNFIINREDHPNWIAAFEFQFKFTEGNSWVFKLPQDWMKALKVTSHILNSLNDK